MLDISRLVDYAIPIIKQEVLQRYEKQIAESEGFDVDYFYGIEFRTGLIAPVDCRQGYTEDLLDAIDEQNKIRQAEGRPSISLVRVLKVNSQVWPPHLYFTFVAKHVPDGTERTYQAKLYTGEELITKIFREKPSYDVLAFGTKRLASEEFVNERDNKRLHARDIGGNFLHHTHGPHPYQISEQPGGSSYDQAHGLYSRNPSGNTETAPPLQHAHFTLIPPLLGKRAKQWRDGDWMCNNCNNHNFAWRSCCNWCQSQK